MGGNPPELDQSRLLLVQRQRELSEALHEIGPHPPCILLTLEAHHEVIAVPHDDDGTQRIALTPLMDPQVEDV